MKTKYVRILNIYCIFLGSTYFVIFNKIFLFENAY